MTVEINIQSQRPRKPRNFYEQMPDGIEDNYVDEMFLIGLVHKSNRSCSYFCRHLSQSQIPFDDQRDSRDNPRGEYPGLFPCKHQRE